MRLLRRVGAPLRPLKAVFSQRAEGYFTFSLLPDRDMPDVAEEDEVTLQASFSIGAAAPLVAELALRQLTPHPEGEPA